MKRESKTTIIPASGTDETRRAEAEHRRAVEDLQKAIDATMRPGDLDAQREDLRRARRREIDAHERMERARVRRDRDR